VPDSEKPTLLLIDGHSLAFRAFYALPIDSFTTRDGQHTNAIHGFISMLLLLLQQQKPTHLAVAFDVSRQSFRTASTRSTRARVARPRRSSRGRSRCCKRPSRPWACRS